MENTDNNLPIAHEENSNVNFQSRLDLTALSEGVEKIKKELDWQPKETFSTGILKTLSEFVR